ncbi:MAG: TatD family hydrolase [Leptospirales bacterium]
MKYFDHHIHMSARTTDDYEAMAKANITAVIEPAFWLGQPRTHVATFEDYYLSLIGWERFRARQFGIAHFCVLGLNPKEANNRPLAKEVLELLPLYLEKDGVVGVGEIGLDDNTPEEEKAFEEQLELAKEHNLPVIVHTPHRDKIQGTRRSIEIVKASGIPVEQVIIDHNIEDTTAIALDSGCWAGHTIYPSTKMDEVRMAKLVKKYGSERITINSSADWGVSDPLKVPKTAQVMREEGITEETIQKIVWDNPVEFFSQSGKLDMEMISERPLVDQSILWQGNSVLRGQKPNIDNKIENQNDDSA